MGKCVYIASANQCPRGQLDVTRLLDYFKVNGWEAVAEPAEADLAVVGGCAFTTPVEDTCIRFLTQIKARMKPGAPLVVCGCLAGINGARVAGAVQGVPINAVATDYLDKLIHARVPLVETEDSNFINRGLLQAATSIEPEDRFLANLATSSRKGLSQCLRLGWPAGEHACSTSQYEKLFYIRVVRGCLEECSYCAIRFANESLRSKPLDAVILEFERGLEAGYKTFYLLGEDVGAYGQDQEMTVVDLLEALFSHEGDFQVVLSDFHPRWFVEYFAELSDILTRNSERIGHLEMPVQSGSDKVLNLMKRRYSTEDVRRCVLSLRRRAPDIHLKTHLIIGFPGETGRDFKRSIQFVRELQFDRVISYEYTDRPGTDATALPHKVPWWVTRLRYRRCCREFG